MTPYTKLQFHLERHMYKRGQYKGDAPADSSRRGKNHFRVVRGNGGQMCVRMYNTNLIEVTPDNKVCISMGGWWTNTTKQNLNHALYTFIGWGGVGSIKMFSHSQMAFRAQGKTYRFYDGMEFDGEGRLLSPPQVFSRRVTDREATAEFRAEIQESGFKDVWPVLFAAAEPMRVYGVPASYLRRYVTSERDANYWPEIATYYKAKYDDHKEAMRDLVRHCTSDMFILQDSDVTVV